MLKKESQKNYLVGKPNLGLRENFEARVRKMLDELWLTNNGPMVQELEQGLTEYFGVKHCIAMNNGTIGLELAIRACGLTGEVIVPSMTFIATAHALQWQGIRPVFADIDPQTLNLCPASVDALISPATTGILGVHLYGRPCAIDDLTVLARRRGLKLIFDAAHAFGSGYRDTPIGNFGDCEVFSFHATKVFNTFEGGAVTTNNDELASRLRLMRNFGFEGEDNVSYIGTNGKMAEINAAMGLTNLDAIDGFMAANKANYAVYEAGLTGIPGITLTTYDRSQSQNYQYVIIRVDPMGFRRSRDELKMHLESHGVMARRYFYPGCHRMEPYRTLYPDAGKMLPVTEAFAAEVLALPTGTQINCDEVRWICGLVREFAR